MQNLTFKVGQMGKLLSNTYFQEDVEQTQDLVIQTLQEIKEIVDQLLDGEKQTREDVEEIVNVNISENYTQKEINFLLGTTQFL